MDVAIMLYNNEVSIPLRSALDWLGSSTSTDKHVGGSLFSADEIGFLFNVQPKQTLALVKQWFHEEGGMKEERMEGKKERKRKKSVLLFCNDDSSKKIRTIKRNWSIFIFLGF